MEKTISTTRLTSLASVIGILLPGSVLAQQDKPNIVVIFGDDIGWQNVSAYGQGTMGYTTPNIDRIANEGLKFTDHYAQPSSTAGRAAFITGQYPIRSGMTTVAMPGGSLGLKKESPTLAEVLKEAGYATGQFGKNHLGDHNFALPTVHGFDEFFGNLYHLNTQEEHEQRDYQNFAKAYSGSIEEYSKKFGTRGVLHCFATEAEDATEDPRFGVVGKQKCTDTGPLGNERMKDFDRAEMIPAALTFIDKAIEADKPFFTWINTSRMHLYTRLNDKWRYAAENFTSEYDFYGSGMLQHDDDIGFILDELKKRGLAENTIVIYTTDNGPEHSSWPHGGTTPFRGEKMTTYEGGVRVPMMVRWPKVLPAGKTLNGIQGHQDLFTTLASAAGVKDVGKKMMDEKKQYIDGVDNLTYWQGTSDKSARTSIFYYFESQLSAVRVGPWKFHFATAEHYYDNLVSQAKPKVYNLRADPFESYDSIDAYGHLTQKVSWLLAPISEMVQQHVESLVKYPPVQGGSTFDMAKTIEDAMKKTQQ
ncbi:MULTISPECIES: arylsulfatase [Photobacterium]|uniref:Arylsulfatase n=1 Tax=Photobacterium ganghwense TaxID=320778 RepID=A0A0J1JX13_9GAMM|nr:MULTISPECIES: arylsulfatase [Photobacterium]KLV06827.1 arylsulfatase [Photobacterium ganghwense]MBV1839150.1 arylsulfatase [Photobacterium ganghwense]PSU10640.1 arylsulfatase [Photobacterium ganghwense]QSV12785.1 arylsulfatase [Photobacterium ganghwense]